MRAQQSRSYLVGVSGLAFHHQKKNVRNHGPLLQLALVPKLIIRKGFCCLPGRRHGRGSERFVEYPTRYSICQHARTHARLFYWSPRANTRRMHPVPIAPTGHAYGFTHVRTVIVTVVDLMRAWTYCTYSQSRVIYSETT